ncbi:hypothetical protein A3C34_02830 [Candidatus Amesbacteria bacterium RIFCSPHIGHO2_02_FULL_48_21]|nr:MAG: hypothetical protein A3C34_02830 [Candidatus Amesbacteria bacterium RIFCSPHIGHO2_02_FULL_48_21]OGC98219.1 MAG: hypothetical protein A2W16_01410 [Candidatus Amesbacteria bacterium RBG_16_48_31]OGD00484.1 MAG: hypothetical protein A2702_00490 [Candidatus Amesbacteria bacterium RIFCSPHIGHO2_01_FULL_48_75]
MDAKTGDRKSRCGGKMTPVGLTFKRVTPDKYKGEKRGELMLVHRCLRCGKVSINRIAGDDSAEEILKLLDSDFAAEGVEVLGRNNRTEVRRQLFGS